MQKNFIKILNFFIILLAFVTVGVYFTGGWKFNISSLHFNITSATRVFKITVILFLIRAFFQNKTASLENFLKNILSFFSPNKKDKSSNIFETLLIFLFFGILLGLCDGLFEPAKLVQTIFTPMPASGVERLSRIGILLIAYGLGSFISAIIFNFIIFIIKDKLKISSPANPCVFLLSVAVAISFFILSHSESAFNLLSPEHFGSLGLTDCIFFLLLSIIIFYILPQTLYNKKTGKVIASFLTITAIVLFYLIPQYYADSNFAEETTKPHRRIILITIDTTRADHLGLYGYDRNTTPYLKEISEKGVLFSRAYSQMTTTDPSHTTILSGVYPRTHGLLKNGMTLANHNIDFLQSWFKKQGFATAAITSRAFLDPDLMELPPFDYKSVPNHKFTKGRGSKKYKYDIAPGTYNRAKYWIDRNLDKDIFMWVHFWDPHGSYSPASPYNSMFNDGYKGMYRYPKEIFAGFTKFKKDYYDKNEIEYINSLYDGEIAFADEYVSKLINYISSKVPDNTEKPLFIITSDHGETLDEIQDKRGYAFDHGKILTYSQMHIPLLFFWDGVLPQGKKIDNIVGLLDIAPTIAELVNDKNKFSSEGISLKKLLTEDENNDFERDFLVSQRRLIDQKTLQKYNYMNSREYGVVMNNWLLRINESRGNELYDILKDPLEQNDLLSENKAIVDELLVKLELWKNEIPETKIKGNIISGKKAKLLKSLGYIQ